jgi:16S rRNA processing protein RimM
MKKASTPRSNSRTDIEELILVGTIQKAHGIDGHVVVYPHTDNPHRFARGSVVLTGDGRTLTVGAAQPLNEVLLVRFTGTNDRTAADGLRGVELFIEEFDRRPLDVDEFWSDQLIGLEVRDGEGSQVGVIAGVDDTTSQHRLLIEVAQKVVVVPLVRALVPEVNLSDGFIVISPIPGLLDDGPTPEGPAQGSSIGITTPRSDPS